MFDMSFSSIQPKRFFVTLLATALTAVSLYADASEPWRQIGPSGAGTFESVVADPQDQQIIYALSSGAGVYKTIDRGMSWELIAQGPHRSGNLQIHPKETSTLYFNVINQPFGDILKSEDGGHNWNSIQPGANDPNYQHILLTELTLDPVSSQVLFARDIYLRDHPDYDWRDKVGGGGVSRSLDGGETWQQVNEGLPHSASGLLVEVTALAVDPLNPKLVYAGVIEKLSKLPHEPGYKLKKMLYRSLDGGDYWEKVTDFFWVISKITLDPEVTTVIYVESSGSIIDFHRSVDGGESWKHFGASSSYGPPGGRIETTSPSTIISMGKVPVRLWKSNDRGDTWESFRVPEFFGWFHYDVNSGVLYAAATRLGQGLYESLDEGQTWRQISHGIHDKDIRQVQMGPGSNPSIYVSEFGGDIYRSSDDGDDWIPMQRFWGARITQEPEFLAVDSTTATIYAIAQHSPHDTFEPKHVFKSHDEGDSWTEMTSTPEDDPETILTHPWDPSMLYMGTTDHWPRSSRLNRSFDGGEAWDVSVEFPPGDGEGTMVPALDPSNPATMYIGNDFDVSKTGETRYFMKSIDSGDSWVTRVDGLPEDTPTTVFDIDAFNSENLVVATRNGIYKTTDGALHWWRVDKNWPDEARPVNILDILIDPLVSSTIYAATGSDGVLKSGDGGVTWEPYGQSQLMGSVNDLEYDVQTRTLFAATSRGGVFARQTVDTGTEDFAIFSDPNPIKVCDGQPGSALIVWRSPRFFPVKVRVGSESGPLFAHTIRRRSAYTGNWVRDGMEFYLLSGYSGEVLAQTTVRTTDSGCEPFTANPNPIQVCEGSVGKTTLSWSLSHKTSAEIRVGSPTGKLLARVAAGGEIQTGNWARDGMQFFLIDRSNQATLGEVTVNHTMDGCAG